MSGAHDIPESPRSEVLFYQAEDGQTRIEVRLDGETAWLSQRQMAEMFQTTPQNITLHIGEIYQDGELDERATCKQFLQVQMEGAREVSRRVNFYNLDVILAVGYKVRSRRGVEFRRWATERLHEFIVKGFTMNDGQLKQAGGGRYFEELLERIRDIRSSEKVFWKQVLDIYATSADYDPRAEMSERFFATVQNRIHWAAHGHTAAEVIAERADADSPHMGLTSWSGKRPRKADVSIAKNYLSYEEVDELNHIVTAYLEFAELQARRRKPMYMADWIVKLDDFLKVSDKDILTNAGRISHQAAVDLAESEFDKFRAKTLSEPSQAEKDFDEAMARLKRLPHSPDGKESGGNG